MSIVVINILTNILANLIFWLFGGILVGMLFSLRRRNLHRFFGVTTNKSIVVYISSFIVEPHTVKDRFGNVRGHYGIGIPNYEFQAITKIAALFSASALDRVPEIFAGLVDAVWLSRQPTVTYEASPQSEDKLRFTNLICLGSPKFNVATDYYMRTAKPYFLFSEESGKFQAHIVRGSRTGEVIDQPPEYDIGVVLRLKDAEHSNTVFIVAGLGVNGTRAAAEFLCDNWLSLYKRYSDNEFGICLRCPGFGFDPDGYKRPELLLQLPS